MVEAISIHALREEGDCIRAGRFWHLRISIHALREEGDNGIHEPDPSPCNFYPRPPRGGRRRPRGRVGRALPFLSTPSARRATSAGLLVCRLSLYFYPRPPRGGRPRLSETTCKKLIFLSTPSARRATAIFVLACLFLSISIHALREEGDISLTGNASVYYDFYPRPPRGGRLTTFIYCLFACYFYPRPPRGGRLDTF